MPWALASACPTAIGRRQYPSEGRSFLLTQIVNLPSCFQRDGREAVDRRACFGGGDEEGTILYLPVELALSDVDDDPSTLMWPVVWSRS